MRDPRYIEPGSLVEVTMTCFQNRFLLRPSDELNAAFVGVVAKAQELCGMDVVAVSVPSSHYHMLLVPEDQEHLSRFMCYVNTNLSKEVGRLHDWPGTKWESSYHAIPVDRDEEVQVKRLRYILAQGVKENLVERPEQWPGVNSAQALYEGRPLIGTWTDRTQLYVQREVQKKDVNEDDFTEEVCLWFSPLPCWAHFSQERYGREVRGLVEAIVEDAAQERRRKGTSVLGVEAILAMDPHHRPSDVSKSPRPCFHTSTVDAYRVLYKAFSEVYAAYRIAAERLRAGFLDAEFPEGTFPCALPFVPIFAAVPRGQP